MRWERVSAGPLQAADKKRDYLAHVTEKAQAGMSGTCLPFHPGKGKMGARTCKLAATLPREIKHTL